jgi:hypothetical protein
MNINTGSSLRAAPSSRCRVHQFLGFRLELRGEHGSGSNLSSPAPRISHLLPHPSLWSSWVATPTGHLGQIGWFLDQTGGHRHESPPHTRGIARRLSDYEVTELITRYREGATVYDLADRYSIHRTTVSGHLPWRQDAKTWPR